MSDFFKDIVGNNKIVCSKSLVSPNGGMQEILKNEITFYNNQGRDVYFVVNPGGTKSFETTHLQTIYVDVDAGRDGNNKYYSTKIVAKFKKRVIKRITDLDIKPSYVVETRNGYQIYFRFVKIINNPSNLEKYKILQTKMYNFFSDYGADKKVQKINQLLRLPGYYWCKKWEGLPKYMVRVVEDLSSGRIYPLKQLSLCFQNENVIQQNSKKDYKPSYEKYTKINTKSSKKSYEKVNYSNEVKTVNTVTNSSSIIDTCDFLEEVSKILHYSNHKFLSKQALELVQKLKTNLTME